MVKSQDNLSLVHDRDKEFVSSPNHLEQLGPYPVSYPVGTGALSIVVERPGRNTGLSTPFCSEAENACSCIISTPPYAFMRLCLINL
jgi:hypothetical protein